MTEHENHIADLEKIASYIRVNLPNQTKELNDALEMLVMSVDEIFNHSRNRLDFLYANQDFSAAENLLHFSKQLARWQKIISEYADFFMIDNEGESPEAVEEADSSQDELKKIPNIADFFVDSTVPHTLHEDFTFKKVMAFKLFNKNYDVLDWKDFIAKVCNVLAEIDSTKFNMFITDSTFIGRSIQYFSNQHIPGRNVRINRTNVYVWNHINAHSAGTLAKKLLRKFNISLGDFFVYLRADLTPLHLEDNEDTSVSEKLNVDKIGRHVKLAMRELMARNFQFQENEILALRSKELSKSLLDIEYPLLKLYDPNVDIEEQIRDRTYVVYWREIFEFNREQYLVTRIWHERQRPLFDDWLNKIHQK
jgi:hypothetical protein